MNWMGRVDQSFSSEAGSWGCIWELHIHCLGQLLAELANPLLVSSRAVGVVGRTMLSPRCCCQLLPFPLLPWFLTHKIHWEKTKKGDVLLKEKEVGYGVGKSKDFLLSCFHHVCACIHKCIPSFDPSILFHQLHANVCGICLRACVHASVCVHISTQSAKKCKKDFHNLSWYVYNLCVCVFFAHMDSRCANVCILMGSCLCTSIRCHTPSYIFILVLK